MKAKHRFNAFNQLYMELLLVCSVAGNGRWLAGEVSRAVDVRRHRSTVKRLLAITCPKRCYEGANVRKCAFARRGARQLRHVLPGLQTPSFLFFTQLAIVKFKQTESC